MFFPERILSINSDDRILEVGPGGSPHPRSDVLLERRFNEREAAAQRGNAPPMNSEKEIVFYDGGQFPFEDKAFDYVICSHVVEHVENIPEFISELTRVAPKGYLEFPNVLYEYLYNFRVHCNLLHFAEGELLWMKKADLPFSAFLPVQSFYYDSLRAGYDEIVVALKEQMFEGFEWAEQIVTRKISDLKLLCPVDKNFIFPPNPFKPSPTPSRELLYELFRRLVRRMCR